MQQNLCHARPASLTVIVSHLWLEQDTEEEIENVERLKREQKKKQMEEAEKRKKQQEQAKETPLNK